MILNPGNGRFDVQVKNIIAANGCSAGGGGGGGGGSGCAQPYTVAGGDTCAAIESKTGVSDAQLHSLNPAINSGCTSMLPFHISMSFALKCFCYKTFKSAKPSA
jgi:hypothetical protein